MLVVKSSRSGRNKNVHSISWLTIFPQDSVHISVYMPKTLNFNKARSNLR